MIWPCSLGSPSYGGNVLTPSHGVRVKVSTVTQVLFKPAHGYCWLNIPLTKANDICLWLPVSVTLWFLHFLVAATLSLSTFPPKQAFCTLSTCLKHSSLLKALGSLPLLLLIPGHVSLNMLMKVEKNKWLSTRLMWHHPLPSKALITTSV